MSSSITSPSPSPSELTGASRPIACNSCRYKRQSCSKDRPKCKRCRDSSIDCVYEEARKITILENYLRELEVKAKAYDDSLAANTQGPAAIPIKHRSGHGADNEKEIAEGNALFDQFGRMDVGERESRSPTNLRSHFKGPGHSDFFLRSMGKLPNLMYPDDMSLDLNPRFYEPGLLAPRRLSVRSHIRLPPIESARRYFAAQYTYIGTIFSFTDPASFEESLVEAYESPPPDLADSEACLKYAKILVILAFGQLYSVNQWIDFKGPPGFEYFSHALQLLPDVHEEGSILAVETLSLIGYFMQNMNRRDAAFLYIGMALRMAISLGLHQEVVDPSPPDGEQGGPSNVISMSEEERERRRRVWWSIYSMDRILCVKSGNPVTIQDEDIGVKPPSKLPSEPEYCPAVVLRHYTQLSRILGEVNKHIYSKGRNKSGSKVMASVKNIMLSLSKWHRELPQELRFDPARLSISRESVSTLVHYYQCINMTARPLLFHVIQKRLASFSGTNADAEKERDWKEGLSQTTINVIETCVSVAQESIKIMSIAAQRDLVATYGYMDSEHIFSAAIVLVMVCIAFPPNQQNMDMMNSGLSLLRGMAERGNSYIDARYRLLDHLRSMIAPVASSSPTTAAPHAAPAAASAAASSSQDASTERLAHPDASNIPPHSPTTASSPPPLAHGYPPPPTPNPSFVPHQHHQHHTHTHTGPAPIAPNTGLHQRTLVFSPIPIATGAPYADANAGYGGGGGGGGGLDSFPGSSSHGHGHYHSHSYGSTTTTTQHHPGSYGSGGERHFPNFFATSGASGGGDVMPGGGLGLGLGLGMMGLGMGVALNDVEEMFFDVNMGGTTPGASGTGTGSGAGVGGPSGSGGGGGGGDGAGAGAGAAGTGAGNNDFGLWEASFTDPAGYDLAQLTHAAQMAADHGGVMGGGMHMDL